nr:hypothetical protein [Candidatus Woesearchaeota archaeon]
MSKYHVYNQHELEYILSAIKDKTPISELEAKLQRPAFSLLGKIKELAKQNFIPKENIKWYTAQYNRIHYEKYKRPYLKQFYNKYKLRLCENAKRYNNQHKAEISKRMKQYYIKNKQKRLVYQKEWNKKNLLHRKKYVEKRRSEDLQKIAESVSNVGYVIESCEFIDETLRILLYEDNIDIEQALKDFRQAVIESNAPESISIDYNNANEIIIYLNRKHRKFSKYDIKFLNLYNDAIKKSISQTS